MATTNPALNENTFRSVARGGAQDTMTVQGTVNKTGLLLLIAVVTGAFSWQTAEANPGMAQLLLWGGLIGGFITALITIFKKEAAPMSAPIYALFEGAFLGVISAMYNQFYDGIVMQAIMLTLGVMGAMLLLYTTGVIKVTEKLRSGIVAATGGIALVYFIAIIMGFFGMQMPFLYDASPIGIGISLLIVGVAAFNLLLDFDLIERGSSFGAPVYMEWYASFGLMVTLIWLYLELLRLLSKLYRSNR